MTTPWYEIFVVINRHGRYLTDDGHWSPYLGNAAEFDTQALAEKDADDFKGKVEKVTKFLKVKA